ncbi:MAG: tRNA adenosine(34) deaminase TadA [bacterium]
MKGFEYFMEEAILEAKAAYQCNEVPVGAIITLQSEIIARAHNEVETRKDPTAHAEILAIQRAAAIIGNHRLTETVMFVTIEPCGMCAGAMVWARIKRLVYGADDPKAGACGSIVNLVQNPRLNHQIEVIRGVLEQEARELIQRFFRERRENKFITKAQRHGEETRSIQNSDS